MGGARPADIHNSTCRWLTCVKKTPTESRWLKIADRDDGVEQTGHQSLAMSPRSCAKLKRSKLLEQEAGPSTPTIRPSGTG